MDGYEVNLTKTIKNGIDGKSKTEIWAHIKRIDSPEITNKLVYWEDEQGHFHDETPKLSIELRTLIDNAWIEKKRNW
jgi:hypothetical protein